MFTDPDPDNWDTYSKPDDPNRIYNWTVSYADDGLDPIRYTGTEYKAKQFADSVGGKATRITDEQFAAGDYPEDFWPITSSEPLEEEISYKDFGLHIGIHVFPWDWHKPHAWVDDYTDSWTVSFGPFSVDWITP
jgi:hypothetical protein